MKLSEKINFPKDNKFGTEKKKPGSRCLFYIELYIRLNMCVLKKNESIKFDIELGYNVEILDILHEFNQLKCNQ